MTTKTISIKEEAYNALKRLKLENESFSDTILRITNKSGNIKYVYENLPKLERDKGETELKMTMESRKEFGRGR